MASMIFTVTRGGDTSVPVLVDYTTQGTGTNPVAADDHLGGVFPSGRITIAAGATTGTITVASNPDSAIEPDETGLLTITSPTAGVTISPATAVYTFTNDDVVSGGSGGGTTTYVYGPTDTRDTGVVDAGSTGYRIETTLYDTAWQLDILGETNTFQPSFRIYANFSSISTKGVFVNADGTTSDFTLMNNMQHPSTTNGKPFAVEVTADGLIRFFYDGTQHTISQYAPLEGGKAIRPYGTLTPPRQFVRFRHGGTVNRSVSIKKL